MCKKLVIVAIAVVAVALVLRKTDLGSYARTCWKDLKKNAKNEVSLEFEIKRLKNDIADLENEQKAHISMAAQKFVAIQNLEGDVERMKASLEVQREELEKANAQLKSNSQTVTFKNVTYTQSRARTVLTQQLNSYKEGQKGLKSKEALLVASKESLARIEEKLMALKDTQRALEEEVSAIETQVEELRVAQTYSHYQEDNSKLARIKEGVQNLKTRVAVERKKLDYQTKFGTDSSVEKKDQKENKDISAEIDAALGANGSK